MRMRVCCGWPSTSGRADVVQGRRQLDAVEPGQLSPMSPGVQCLVGWAEAVPVSAGRAVASAVQFEADAERCCPGEARAARVDVVQQQVLDVAVGRLWSGVRGGQHVLLAGNKA